LAAIAGSAAMGWLQRKRRRALQRRAGGKTGFLFQMVLQAGEAMLQGSRKVVMLAWAAMLCVGSAQDGRAEVLNIIQTTVTQAQTDLDVDHSYAWTFSAAPAQTFDAVTGKFVLKKGPQATAPVILELWEATSAFTPTTLVGQYAFPASSGSQSAFVEETFFLTTTSTVLDGNYYLSLTSAAASTANTQWFIKDPTESVVFQDGSGQPISGITGGGAVPVPEPQGIAVWVGGGLAAGWLRWRTRRRVNGFAAGRP
jgi:hypothetical protein